MISDDTMNLKVLDTKNPLKMFTKLATIEKLTLCMDSNGFQILEEKAQARGKGL